MKTCSRARFRVCKLLLLSFGSSLMKAASIVRDFCYILKIPEKNCYKLNLTESKPP